MNRRVAGILAISTSVIAAIRLLIGHIPGIGHVDLGMPWWTGLGLGLLLILLVDMPLTRVLGTPATTKQVKFHTSIGFVGPLLLAAHTASLGYGYTWILCLLFLATFCLGGWMLIRPAPTGAGRRRQQAWHTFIGTMLVPIVLFHIWVVLYYE